MKVPFFRAWTQEFDRRLALRRRMMLALGIAPQSRASRVQEDLRQTMLTCTACREDAACARWLGEDDPRDGPPEFCPNRARFLALMAES